MALTETSDFGGHPGHRGPAESDRTSDTGLVFRRPSELRALGTAPLPESIWEGFAACRHTTLLSGKPKVGKSKLLAALGNAVVGPATAFLGHAVTTGEVVVTTEESRSLTLSPSTNLSAFRF